MGGNGDNWNRTTIKIKIKKEGGTGSMNTRDLAAALRLTVRDLRKGGDGPTLDQTKAVIAMPTTTLLF